MISFTIIEDGDFDGPSYERAEAHLKSAEALVAGAENAIAEGDVVRSSTAVELALAHASIAQGWIYLRDRTRREEVDLPVMPEECDPQEGVHVALNGELRCRCPERMKV